MSVRRTMGIETEYGISVPGRPHANPMLGSGQVVQAYGRSDRGADGGPPSRVRWDYAGESPLQDARGFARSREHAHPSQLTDEWVDDPSVANVVLTNGARLYVDHAHPEYSSPEVSTPREALVWDRAGELVMAAAAATLAREQEEGRHDGEGAPNLYKNNTDGKGASYGTHENYLVRRETPFRDIVAGLTPFFVVRQIVCGAGRVGIGQTSDRAGYQIASRSDFFEAEVGLETTFKRPIINTRDEPHAVAERYRRLHVILGDANLADVAGLLKTGMTSLVLGMIEDGAVPAGELAVAQPVAELRALSHDTSLTHLVALADGRRVTGLDLLWRYHDLADAWLERRGGRDADTDEVMTLWADVLTRLGDDPSRCAADLDWVAKLALLQGYRERDGLGWADPRLRAVDIQWSDVRPEKGLARRLEARGRLRRLTTDEEVARAVTHPPESTRAFFRGECVRRYGREVAAASWESVVFDTPEHEALQWVGTLDPHRGTAQRTRDLLDRSPDASALLRELAGR